MGQPTYGFQNVVYYGRGMIIITYVDDTLFFGRDITEIEKFITELEEAGYALTREEGDETAVSSRSLA